MRHTEQHIEDPLAAPSSLRGGLPASELLDSTLDSIMVYRLPQDAEPELIYANRAAAETRGYRHDEIIGLRLSQIVAPEEVEAAAVRVRQLPERRHLSYETVHRRKDGSTFPVEVRVSLFDAPGDPIAVSVVRDISESMALRLELDGALQRALADRSQLRTMMDVVPVGMALVGPNAEVLEVNRANEQIWRTAEHPKPPELEGYTVFRGWDPETGELMQPSDWPVADVMKTGRPVYDRIVEIERFDGSRGKVEISAIPVKDAQGSVQSMVVLTIDVTDRERREKLAAALDDLNLEIHATLNRDRILDRVLARTVSACGADFGVIAVVDGHSCELIRSLRSAQGPGSTELSPNCADMVEAVHTKKPVFVEDAMPSADVSHDTNDSMVASSIIVPMMVPDGESLALEIGFATPRNFDHADRDFARKVGDFASFALDNARLYSELGQSLDAIAEKDAAIRQAYSDVIEAVTGGRLVILDPDELRDEMIPDAEPTRLIDAPSQLAEARRSARQHLDSSAVADDMMLAFGEALNNALKYAGEASYTVGHNDSKVQIVVSDTGPGIDFGNLPKATLISGYSTKQTLGVGFTLMMELTDRVLLCTGDDGTTVVLERELDPGEDQTPRLHREPAA